MSIKVSKNSIWKILGQIIRPSAYKNRQRGLKKFGKALRGFWTTPKEGEENTKFRSMKLVDNCYLKLFKSRMYFVHFA